MTDLAVGGRTRRIGVDGAERPHDRQVTQDVARRALRGRGVRNVVARLVGLGEITHVETSVAALAVGTARRRRRRVPRILRGGRPVDHLDAIPAHAGLVAGLTVVDDAGMVHRRAGEGREIRRAVAGFAGVGGRHVRLRLARRMDVVVATHAVVGDANVIVMSGLPRQLHDVAGAAFGRSWNMGGGLADRLHAVMAAAASPQHVDMVELRNRTPTVRGMALRAIVARQDVVGRLGGRANARTGGMAGETVLRGPLEDAADVAALARHALVLPDQVEPGRKMIESRRAGVAGERREQATDAEQGRGKCQPGGTNKSLWSTRRHC